MPNYFAEHALQLLDLGYEPVPIRPGTKAPDINGWTTMDLTSTNVGAWAANGRAGHGVGLRTGSLCPIDIDILDEGAAELVRKWCEGNLGLTHVRQGQAPKLALLYRRHTPGPKLTSPSYTDVYGDIHRVEVLGQGQQLVMYHTHPVTGKAYRHSAKDLPRLDQLPMVTDDELRELLAYVDTLAKDMGWEVGTTRDDKPQEQDNPSWDEDERALAHMTPRVGLTLAEADALLAQLDASDHSTWTTVAAALRHEFGDDPDAFVLFDTWSQNADNYGGTDRYWSFTPSPHDRDPITMRSVQHLAHAADQRLASDPDVLDKLEPDTTGFKLCDWDSIATDNDMPHQIVEDLLVRGQVSLVAAQPNTGKSAFILDLAAHIARGATWRDKQVEQCEVLYLAAESPESIRARILAMRDREGWSGLPLRVLMDQIALGSPESQLAFGRKFKAYMAQFPLTRYVVLDTYRSAASVDENSSKEMGDVVRFLYAIAKHYKIHLTIVHHLTKSGESYAGSGLMGAIVDTEIRITGPDKKDPEERELDGLLKAFVVQQRSLTGKGDEFWYEIGPHDTGRMTNFGKPETAPLVRHILAPELSHMRAQKVEAERAERASKEDDMTVRLLQVIGDTPSSSYDSRAAATGIKRPTQEKLINAAIGKGLVVKSGNILGLTEAGKGVISGD